MKKREPTKVQAAIVKMRKRLDLSQQELATQMGKALMSINRWETTRPPKGQSLYELWSFAIRSNCEDLAKVFSDEMHNQEAPWVIAPVTSPWATIEQAFVNLKLYRWSFQGVNTAYVRAIRSLVEAHALLFEAAGNNPKPLNVAIPLELLEETRKQLEEVHRDAKAGE